MINSDRRLSKFGRIGWLFANWLNNTRATRDLDQSLEFARFRTGNLHAVWSRVDATASPARRLCDMFWLSLPWEQIARQLNGSVRALEVGCGSGRYGFLLQDCLDDALAEYVGLDLTRDPQWDRFGTNSKFKFICTDSRTTGQYLTDVNLIITQSAIEHFEEDLDYFRQIADYIAITDRPVIQVHLMPSAACLTTYLWHGVRQYTPRTLSRVTRLFGSETSKRLYFLGSRDCNRVHRRYITYPWFLGKGDQRAHRAAAYDRELRQAVRQDDIRRTEMKRVSSRWSCKAA